MHNSALHALLHPMAITERWLRVLADHAVNPTGSTDVVQSLKAATDDEAETARIIRVSGPLSKELSMWSWLFGGTSYAGIRHELDEAYDSGLPIVLVFDSPGGEVFGLSECADAIYAMRGKGARIHAYVEGQCDSAAYWLASQCDSITINDSGEAGSIGVRCVVVDDSKAMEQAGVVVYDIVADQSPLKVVDASKAADRARVKAQMSAFAGVFIAAVARGRGVSIDTVLSDFGRGDVMVGQAAVDAGLCDKVGTLDSLLAELSAGANEMKNQTVAAAPEGKPAASVSSGKCSGCRSEMSGSDPMYCKGCFDGDDDEDDMEGKKAHAFRAAVLALLACDDEAKAIGALTGYKAQAEQATAKLAEIEAQLAAANKAKLDAEVGAKLDAACADGRIKPAAREQFAKLYADHGAAALDAALSVLTPAVAAPAAEPATEKAAQEAAKVGAEKAKTWARQAPVLGDLTDEQKAVIAKIGVAPEKFEAHRRAMYKNIVDTNTENK